MSFDFTPAQRLAIEERGGSILVSAAAGSGKTRVLTERLIRRVTDPADPVDIDRFLVITYTRAAAAELRTRIFDALSACAAAQPEDRRLRRQQNLCCRARIGTIHSFCTEVIRGHCHVLGITPAFKVMEEDRAAALKAAVLTRLLEKRYETILTDAAFRALTDTVGAGRDDRRLEAAVLSLHNRLRSHPYPEDWAAQQKSALALDGVSDAGDTVWGRELLGAAAADLRRHAAQMQWALDEICTVEDKLKTNCEALFSFETAQLAHIANALDAGWDAARDALIAAEFARFNSPRNYADPALLQRVKAVRDAAKGAVRDLQERFAEPSGVQLADLRATVPAMVALLDLTLDFDRAYGAEKLRRGELDFSDLEHCAAQLLVDKRTGRPTWIAMEYATRFCEVMVDEYQDVNAVQEMIFKAVSLQERNLFLVGDVKQSIYRFRLADPTLFLEKYNSYLPAECAGAGEPRRILLQENFRSRCSVLDAANLVFSNIMSEELGELDYDADAALRAGAQIYGDTPDAPVELCILNAADGDDEETPAKCEQEARYAAGRIAAMLREGTPVQTGEGPRPCRPGDFALLLHSPKTNGAVFHRALAEAGVPVRSRQGSGFFTSLEVTVAINLLSVIDNPRADVPLICVLRSPAFGFTADELSEIRAADRSADFYTALRAAAAAGSARCAAFAETLDRWRALAADLPLDSLVWRLCSETDLFAVCTAMRGGGERRRNLMRLFEYARSFSDGACRSVSRFVTYLRRLAEKGVEPEFQDSGDAVQILSIHKSKGLEFPFVFLCDLAHRFNKGDLRESVLMHSDLGLGPKRTDTARGVEYPTLARRAIEYRLTTEKLSEEMRVLYVAMTRAKERLVMSCVWKDAENKLEKLRMSAASPAAPGMLRAALSPSQWLAMAAVNDERKLQIRIVTEAAPAAAASPDQPQSDLPQPGAAAAAPALDALRARLAFAYPHAAAVALPSKLTATGLKRAADAADAAEAAPLLPPEEEAPRGAFRRVQLGAAPRLSAAERGTATHSFLQYLSFDRADSMDALRAELARIAAAGHLSPAEAGAVDLTAVRRLFASPLGRELAQAKELRREFRFMLLRDAADWFEGTDAEDQILLQGIVDCFFVENGAVTVVDYKTDRVAAEEVPARAEHYRVQMETYADALRRILGLPVRRCVLWFLRAGVGHTLPMAED